MSLPRPETSPAAQTPVAIRLEGVSLGFDGQEVLKGVNLEVRRGEFIAILGPSGGGKSTLLRIVAGLLGASEGKVEVRGESAMVFQDYRLLPWRTVKQNIGLPIELTGRGRIETHLGMERFGHLYPHQLSGGMKARVAIARALAQDAEVLLMDEPFAALDALVRERFNLELRQLHQRTGKTVLFVTHSIREAVYLADRVVVLKGGRIETILDTQGEGRLTAFDVGLEAELRERLGVADSTFVEPPPRPLRPPWELFGVIGLTALFFLAWGLMAARVPVFVPSPAQTAEAIVQNLGLLLANAGATLQVAGLGILCSLLIGLPVGYVMGRSQALERLLSPFIVALQAVPTIIIAPLLIIWFGYGLGSKVTIATLISIFPVMVSGLIGVREVDRTFREVLKTMGSSGWGVFTKLEVPGALPVILGGLRLTVSLALIGAVVAEFVLGAPGLGAMASSERLNFRYANSFAAVAVTVLLGIGLYGLVALIESYVLRYRRK
ncbi:MAG: ABC transporter permease subunit [Meiothermus sp.]|nr:ABC transporter permease subunit [Meiothermus sp.]